MSVIILLPIYIVLWPKQGLTCKVKELKEKVVFQIPNKTIAPNSANVCCLPKSDLKRNTKSHIYVIGGGGGGGGSGLWYIQGCRNQSPLDTVG